MNNSFYRTMLSLPIGALCFSLIACAGQQNQTADSGENVPPNHADIHQEEMKESEEVAEERRIDAAEEATEDVDNAEVIESDETALTTEDVDTEPDD